MKKRLRDKIAKKRGGLVHQAKKRVKYEKVNSPALDDFMKMLGALNKCHAERSPADLLLEDWLERYERNNKPK